MGFSFSSNPGTEGSTVTITYTNDTGITDLFSIYTSDFTATAGSDYAAFQTTVALEPEQSFSFDVQLYTDNVSEGEERFFINANGMRFGTGTSMGIVDQSATLAINSPAAVAEGSGTGTTFIDFTVTRSGSTSGTASANYAIAGSGTNPASASDFNFGTANPSTAMSTALIGQTGTVSFADGQSTAVIRVPVRQDYTIENDETFTVTLSNPSNATLATATGTGTITNDDLGGVFSINSVSIAEGASGNSAATLRISRTGGTGDATITYYTAGAGMANGATATSGADYVAIPQASPQTATFANGATFVDVTVQVTGDRIVEPNETFFVSLNTPSSGSIAAGGGMGTVTILNDDFAGAFSVADVSVTEGDSLSQSGQFVVTRTGGTAPTTIAYTITNGGSSNTGVATANADYSAPASGTLTFAADQLSAVVQFTVIGDTLVEGNEQFKLTLSNPANGGTIARQVGIATIIDNDVPAGSTPQQGGPGNDVLIAQTNPSILIGGAGDDTYLVHNAGDVVIENNGGGIDIVYTDVSYNLGSNEVEALSTSQQTDTANINLIGNFASQTIVGNYGDNILNGGSGADTLIGLFGNDTYVVGDSRIVIVEQAGQGTDTVLTSVNYTLAAGVSVESLVAQDRASTAGLILTGNEVAQVIGGTNGADTINGGAGNDTLLGFGGADVFAFTTALGAGNVDTILDFSTTDGDRIGLGTSIFAGIGTTLDANEFVIGTAATGATAQIVYNQATGQLFYDADGTGTGAAILFAQIAPNTALTTAAFTVV